MSSRQEQHPPADVHGEEQGTDTEIVLNFRTRPGFPMVFLRGNTRKRPQIEAVFLLLVLRVSLLSCAQGRGRSRPSALLRSVCPLTNQRRIHEL